MLHLEMSNRTNAGKRMELNEKNSVDEGNHTIHNAQTHASLVVTRSV